MVMNKKRMAGLTCIFLALMLLFTVLSRAADSVSIANVKLGKPQNMMITHEVRGTGRVEQNQEQAVVTVQGQRVKTIYVNTGQEVAKGELLFELDKTFLEESILSQKQEIQKLQLQMQDVASRESVNAQHKANDQAQAAENYSLSTTRASAALSHARSNLDNAKKELKKYREKQGISEESTLAEEQLVKLCEEKAEAYIQAQQNLQTLEWRIEKAVDDALTEAMQGGTATYTENIRSGTQSAEIDIVDDEEQSQRRSADTPMPIEQKDISISIEQEQQGLADLENDSAGGFSEPDIIIDEIRTADGQPVDGWSADNPGITDQFPDTADSSDGSDLIFDDPLEAYTPAEPQTPQAGTPSQQITPPTQQELDEIEKNVRDYYSAELNSAKKDVEDALKEKQKADDALASYQQDMLSVRSSKSAAGEQQLIDAVRAAQNAYEDAAIAANEAAVTGNRGMQTAGIPNASDSTWDIYELSLEQLELELSKLEELLEADGKIEAPVDGIVTKVNITTGEKTSDGMAVMLADVARGCRLTVQIPQEQEKYIGRGDLVTIKGGNGRKTLEEIPVESVTADAENDSVRLVTVQIPADTLQMGETATLELTKKSEAYPICIPISALHVDSKNQPFVLAVQEVNSVLGTEMEAYNVPVTVEDKNDKYAALTQGVISNSQEIIVSSDKAVGEGSRVRIGE